MYDYNDERVISLLKKQAKQLGLTTKTADPLKLAEEIKVKKEEIKANLDKIREAVGSTEFDRAINHEEVLRQKKLVRVQITSNSPLDLMVEEANYKMHCITNTNIGKLRCVFPIDGSTWHLPRAMVNSLKSLKFIYKGVKANKTPGAEDYKVYAPEKNRIKPRFNVTELPDLTDKELKALRDTAKEAVARRNELTKMNNTAS